MSRKNRQMPRADHVKKRRQIPAALLILVIMLVAFAFRFVVRNRVDTLLGEAGTDPETGLPYLTEMDAYYHLRMTRDLEETGHPGEIVRDGEPWDTLSYAPTGRSAGDYRPLMAGIAVAVHRVLSFFGPITLEQVTYWLGAVLSVLVVIPVFLFVRRLRGTLAAVTASVLAAMNYGYFTHTVPGFYDTDCVILVTSCAFFLCSCPLVNGLKEGHWSGRALVLFAGALVLLHLAWSVDSLFVGILLVAVLGMVVLRFLVAPKEERGQALRKDRPLLLLALGLGLGMICLNPGLPGMMVGLVRELFTGGPTLFPNAYVSVAELRRPALVAGGINGLSRCGS